MTGVPAERHPRDRARVCDREARGRLLHARDHRARLRRRQRLVALEPRPDDRPPRLRVDRAERTARTEQRPGPERRGRQSVLFPRLPAAQRSGHPREVRRALGRGRARDAGLPARPDDVRPPRRARQGPLPDRREPGADGAERAPRRGGPRPPRVHGRAGPVPERVDARACQRRLPRLELRREGRDVHEHRAAREPRAQGARVPRQRARGLADRGRPRERARRRLGVHPRGAGVGRVRRPRTELVGHPLRPNRGAGNPVAVPGPRPPRLAFPARAAPARTRAGRASSSRSSTSPRSSSPTRSIRSSSRPAGRSTTTTRRR